MSEENVVLIADKRHEAFNCDGKAYQIIEAGQTFSTSEGRASNLIQRGFAHLAIVDASSEADEQPEPKPIPVVEPVVAKVDGRTKAGRAHKGR